MSRRVAVLVSLFSLFVPLRVRNRNQSLSFPSSVIGSEIGID